MDKKIKCQDCGEEFVFTVSEQRFFEEKGFEPPKRCRYCRQQRKINKERRQNYGN